MKRYQLWLLLIILLALALRLYNLTYHSLWFDEAVSVYWARQSVPRLLEVGFTLVEDRLPPLYYLTLKGWGGVFGFSETSVRLLSVFFGVLLVPAAAGVAAALFTHRLALFTASLVALNPFLVWYAQEARMYAPAVLFGALTVWAFLRFLKLANDEQRMEHHSSFIVHRSLFTILFIFFAIAGLYSHLYTGFLLPALGLWLIISYPRAWRLWAWFAVCGIFITAMFAPLTLPIWRFSGEAVAGEPWSSLGQRVWWLWESFTAWQSPLSPAVKTAVGIAYLLFVISAYLPRSPTRRPQLFRYPRLLVTLLLLLPFVIASLLLYRNHLAFFGERYFIVMVPWLLLLAALGANNLGIRAKQILNLQPCASQINDRLPLTVRYSPFIILLILTVVPIPGQWSILASKEAWRQSVAYLARHTQADHGILIHPDWVRHPFQFYFQGPGQTYAAFSHVTSDTPLDGPLQGVVNNHPVIWLVQSHLDSPDPGHRVEAWFAARYPLVTELYPPGISLKAYATSYKLKTLPPEAVPVDISFENGMRLIGYQADPVTSATDLLFHPPSGWLHVTLYWSTGEPATNSIRPYVHLVGPEGVWGANLERAHDALTRFPPTQWAFSSTGQTIIRHDMDVNLNPVTPPGTYQLVVGLHGSDTQHLLGEVDIQ